MKFLVSVFVFFLLVHIIWGIKMVKVSGKSMQPTLFSGDLLLTIRPRKINRFDCVVFKHKNKLYVKRVIALPNEMIKIQSPYTLINHQALFESYLMNDEVNRYRKAVDAQILKDHYFVMGDNRRSSLDSRGLGAIHRDAIVAKVVLRVRRKLN